MSDFINTIDVLGDVNVANSIIDRSIAEYKDNNVSKVGNYAFYFCQSLTAVNCPSATSVGEYSFMYCTALTTVNLPSATSIKLHSFYGCSLLTTLCLRSATMCSLSSTIGFKNTPIANGTGYIYVPSVLIDSYKSATNWSTYASQFRALEDYTVDGTITGELDPNKI